ncbi:hypothetical protein CGC48_05130 [Capnocytophaga cynodegmi]|uniref:Uncharacterized protein n=1 Tax=Capnocytophaga cynodegmi TaxID=28189 RepID=A0A250E8J6_9FLAO|nr:hypothetical protein [Capnocytophaga cynodegmi]ATA68068.1 hypothetical protein CGC48_05130 [Capnocytophaga cynodegmi]
MVNISGNLEETSSAYYHTAQSGDVIIQSADISKFLGKVDAKVNKTSFQKPRCFIEDVNDRKRKKRGGRANNKMLFNLKEWENLGRSMGKYTCRFTFDYTKYDRKNHK